MTLAIAHDEDGVATLDAIREAKPPFSPEAVVREFVDVLKLYRVGTVSGDRYAGEWPRERFSEHGVGYGRRRKTKAKSMALSSRSSTPARRLFSTTSASSLS